MSHQIYEAEIRRDEDSFIYGSVSDDFCFGGARVHAFFHLGACQVHRGTSTLVHCFTLRTNVRGLKRILGHSDSYDFTSYISITKYRNFKSFS